MGHASPLPTPRPACGLRRDRGCDRLCGRSVWRGGQGRRLPIHVALPDPRDVDRPHPPAVRSCPRRRAGAGISLTLAALVVLNDTAASYSTGEHKERVPAWPSGPLLPGLLAGVVVVVAIIWLARHPHRASRRSRRHGAPRSRRHRRMDAPGLLLRAPFLGRARHADDRDRHFSRRATRPLSCSAPMRSIRSSASTSRTASPSSRTRPLRGEDRSAGGGASCRAASATSCCRPPSSGSSSCHRPSGTTTDPASPRWSTTARTSCSASMAACRPTVAPRRRAARSAVPSAAWPAPRGQGTAHVA